nr:hypothetical protein [Pandoravirus massiliensis]
MDGPNSDGQDGDGASGQQLALLVACIDRHRLCADDTLLGACFRHLVAPARLCVAFARPDRGAPWTDRSPLGEALRTHLNFSDACRALQKTVAHALLGGPPPLPFVACCGCARPWCAARPCATGWMLPISERARNRLAAWQWGETIHPDMSPFGASFGGFFTRELVQCTTADLGCRLMPCPRRRRSPVDAALQSHPCEPLQKRSRANGDNATNADDAEAARTPEPQHGPMRPEPRRAFGGDDRPCRADDGCGDDGDNVGGANDNDGDQGDARDTIKGGEPDVPMVMSCGPRGVIAIRDGGMYVAAVTASRRRDLVEHVHPSIPGIRARDSRRDSGGGARRWVRVAGDAFIVRVHAPASLTDPIPWDAQG